MKWEDILKVDINIRDAQRLGRDYSIRDMYEGKLVSQEEYDEMTDVERRNYHGRIANYLRYAERSRGINLGSLGEELRFHNIMQSRLHQGSILPTYPTYFEGYATSKIPERKREDTLLDNEREAEEQQRIDREMELRDAQTENRREREEQKKRRNVVPSLIVDYFTMYRNRGLGMPTIEDIAREEGRELTAEELDGYRKYRAGFEG
jgi:hypothetical protein